MSTSVVVTLLATFTAGLAIGGGVTRLMMTAQVTCTTPAEAKRADDGMSKLLQSKPIPLTGYRSY